MKKVLTLFDTIDPLTKEPFYKPCKLYSCESDDEDGLDGMARAITLNLLPKIGRGKREPMDLYHEVLDSLKYIDVFSRTDDFLRELKYFGLILAVSCSKE